MKQYQNEVTAVYGHRGSGKSTWLFRNLESFKPFVLIDPLYDPKFASLNLYEITEIENLIDCFRNGRPERVYIAPGNDEIFNLICLVVMAYGHITLVIDEVDQYATSYKLPDNLKKLVKYGRHREVNLVMVSRRPMEMNKLLRSQVNRFIIFPMSKEDIKELETHIGKEAEKINSLTSIPNKSSQYLEYQYGMQTAEIKNIKYFS